LNHESWRALAGGRPWARAGVAAAFALVSCATPARAQVASAPAHPFQAGTSTFELNGAFLLESWNKNLSTEQIRGGTIGRGHVWKEGLLAMLEITLARVADGQANDAFFIGFSGGVRWRVVERGGMAGFIEAGVGISSASARVPGRGSYFNYMALGGGGVTVRLASRWHGVTGVRVLHLSNAGIFGEHRNPDIEAIGGYAGLLVTF
jgi:hypothetical protein